MLAAVIVLVVIGALLLLAGILFVRLATDPPTAYLGAFLAAGGLGLLLAAALVALISLLT